MKKKILLVYASYGSGHKAIANYLANYIKSNDKDIEVATLDILTCSMNVIGSISQKVNSFFMLKTPSVHNFFYNLTSTKIGGDFIDSISMSLFKNKKMEKKISDFNPDIVIATHFFGPSIIKYYNEKGIINAKIVTVITDYDVIELWAKQHMITEYFIVSNEDMSKDLIKRGVSKEKIKNFGIPIAPIEDDFDKKKLLKQFKFNNNLICTFFGGGGNGSSKTLPYIKKVAKNNPNLNIIYVAGKNEFSKDALEQFIAKKNLTNVRVLGFVNNIPDLLKLSDFVITKPGGIQLTECLYFNKPVLMIRNSGGQEIANYKYFEKQGYGKYFKTPWGLNKYTKFILDNQDIINEYSNNMSKIKNDESIKKVFDLIEEMKKDQ